MLFSTLFCLVYLYILISEKDRKIDLKNIAKWKRTALLSVLAGIAYLLGLFLMPTMIVFALIVVLFTVIQFVISVYRDKPTEYLLVANTIIFAVAIIGLMLFGFKSAGLDLASYSVGHVYAYLAVIVGTVVLYLLARYLKGKPKYYYPLSLIGLAVICTAILSVAGPQFFNQLYQCSGPVLRSGTGDQYSPGSTWLVHCSCMDDLQLRTHPYGWRDTGYPVQCLSRGPPP